MFDEIPVSTIKVPEGRFPTWKISYPCPRSLDESRAALRIKHSRKKSKEEEQALAYRMSCDKNAIGWRRWNVAAQERKVDDMEVEIITFVVKGSAQLAAPSDRQE